MRYPANCHSHSSRPGQHTRAPWREATDASRCWGARARAETRSHASVSRRVPARARDQGTRIS